MYNVGLIGCGRWGSNHLNVLVNEVGTSINNLYVVDTDPIQHQAVEKCFTIDEFDQVLDLIDIAIIASPNQHHVSQAKQCLEQNIHVLVEKPLAQSMEELQPLLEVMTTTSAYLQVGYLLNSHPAITFLDQHLSIDKIESIDYWRTTTRLNRSLTHPVDAFLVHALALFSHLGIEIRESDITYRVDESLHSYSFTSTKDISIKCNMGWNAVEERRHIEITTRDATMHIDFGNPGFCTINNHQHRMRNEQALQSQWKRFLSNIQNKQTPPTQSIETFQHQYEMFKKIV
jgi:predicted dehydrogenase